MKSKKVSISAILSAVGTGASYELAMQGAAKRVDFINENYLVVKSLAAGLIGSGLVYFSKPTNEPQRVAGYGLLAIAGASGASKLSTVLITSGDNGMNGVPKLNKIKASLASRRKSSGLDQMKRSGMFSKVREQQMSRPGMATMHQANNMVQSQFHNRSLPQNAGVNYDQLAYSDLIYNM